MMAKSEPLITWNFFSESFFFFTISHNPIQRASTRFRRARSGRPQALPTRSLDTLCTRIALGDLPTATQFSPACCLRHSETAAANVENFSPYKRHSLPWCLQRWHAHKRIQAGSVTQPLSRTLCDVKFTANCVRVVSGEPGSPCLTVRKCQT